MSQPSPGLAVAWRIAATEAGAAGCKKIECSHLMMGLLSLEKATPRVLQDLGFGPAQAARVGAERAAIDDFLAAYGKAGSLEHVRKRLGLRLVLTDTYDEHVRHDVSCAPSQSPP